MMTNRIELLVVVFVGHYEVCKTVAQEKFLQAVNFHMSINGNSSIYDCAKDGGKEFLTKIQCVLITNP